MASSRTNVLHSPTHRFTYENNNLDVVIRKLYSFINERKADARRVVHFRRENVWIRANSWFLNLQRPHDRPTWLREIEMEYSQSAEVGVLARSVDQSRRERESKMRRRRRNIRPHHNFSGLFVNTFWCGPGGQNQSDGLWVHRNFTYFAKRRVADWNPKELEESIDFRHN